MALHCRGSQITGTAENLQAIIGDADVGLGGKGLHHCGNGSYVLAAIYPAGEIIGRDPAHVYAGRYIGDLVRDGLEGRDRLAELMALLAIADRLVENGL